MCVSEMWCSNTELQNNSNLSLTAFDSVLYERLEISELVKLNVQLMSENDIDQNISKQALTNT